MVNLFVDSALLPKATLDSFDAFAALPIAIEFSPVASLLEPTATACLLVALVCNPIATDQLPADLD